MKGKSSRIAAVKAEALTRTNAARRHSQALGQIEPRVRVEDFGWALPAVDSALLAALAPQGQATRVPAKLVQATQVKQRGLSWG